MSPFSDHSSSPDSQKLEAFQRKCWNHALHLHSTGYIYGRKSGKLSFWLRVNQLLGVIVPVMIGGLFMTYGVTSELSIWGLQVAGILALPQLFLSTICLVYKWEDQVAYFLESTIDNNQLSGDFQAIAEECAFNPQYCYQRFALLDDRRKRREQLDERYPFSEKEMRRGLRWGLRNFQRQCSACGVVPISSEASDCPVCGNF